MMNTGECASNGDILQAHPLRRDRDKRPRPLKRDRDKYAPLMRSWSEDENSNTLNFYWDIDQQGNKEKNHSRARYGRSNYYAKSESLVFKNTAIV